MNTAITKLNSIVAGIGGEEDDYATVIAAIEGKLTAALATIIRWHPPTVIWTSTALT